jgi:serine/threonine protein kinase
VVHRDVKPGNVLIAEDGRVKITDFGVSRAVDDVQLTRTGLIAGTPAFLAPEIARGHEPTAASDVFALGSTLYTAVEGIPPFGLDDNAYALLHKVAMGDVTPPQQAGPLEQVLMTLLATDPLDRPTASQAREALALVAAGQAPAPAPAPPTPPRRSSLLAAFGGGRNGGRNGGRTDRPATGRPPPARRPSAESPPVPRSPAPRRPRPPPRPPTTPARPRWPHRPRTRPSPTAPPSPRRRRQRSEPERPGPRPPERRRPVPPPPRPGPPRPPPPLPVSGPAGAGRSCSPPCCWRSWSSAAPSSPP